MKIYNFDKFTKEYLYESEAQLDPLETIVQKKNVYLLPSNATFIEPPITDNNSIAICENNINWVIKDDYRGKSYYDINTLQKITINEIGITIPENYPLESPPSFMIEPKWENNEWIESAIIYQGIQVKSISDINDITKQIINNSGEDKAKTEKLISESNDCPIWDNFLLTREKILQEGRDFINKHFNVT